MKYVSERDHKDYKLSKQVLFIFHCFGIFITSVEKKKTFSIL